MCRAWTGAFTTPSPQILVSLAMQSPRELEDAAS
jgi:hypothetical protein